MELEKCGMCDFPEVTHHCAECPVYLCSRCSISHTRSKATNNHALADFTRVTTGTTIAPAEEPSLSAEPVPTFCSTHQDIQISIFCSTCNDIICRKCQQISHIDHQICDVDKSKMNLQRLCLDNIKRLFDTSSTLETVDEELKSTKVANTQKLHQIETELTHRKNALFKHINSTYDESLSKVQNEKKRIEQVFERVTNERKDSMKLSQELKAKLFNVQHTDDISSLVSIVKDFNNVFPNIEHVVVKSSTDAVRSNCKGFLQSKDNADRALSSVQQFLGLEINDDKSTLVSNGAHRKTANKVDVTSADDCGSSTVEVDIFSPRSGMPISPQGEQEPTSSTDQAYDMHSTPPSFQSRSKNVVDGHLTEVQCQAQGARPKHTGRSVNTNANLRDVRNNNPKSKIDVHIYAGDLALQFTDAIVHPTSYTGSSIHLYDAVGQTLKKAGGKGFEEACKQTGQHIQQETIVTVSGNLPCKAVIHVNTRLCAYSDDWVDGIRKCLSKAEASGFTSIAFPAMGHGVEDAAKARYFKDALEQFKQESPRHLARVHLVLQTHHSVSIYQHIILGSSVDADKYGSLTQGRDNSSPVTNNSIQFGTVKLVVLEGDIATNSSDMIVHGTYNSYREILLDDPVGKSLKKAGGAAFKHACTRADIKPGKYTITTNGKLPCKQVLHLDISNSIPSDSTQWEQRLLSVLLRAECDKMTSIAFPPFSASGHTDISWRNMATLIKDVVFNFSISSKPRHVKCVQIVIYKNRKLYGTFVDTIISRTSGATRATDQQRGTIKIAGRRVSSQLEIVGGDLTDEKTDAIVHATNTQWSFQNSVVGKAIMKKGGNDLIDERNKARSSKFNDGKGKITGISESGDLDCQFVIYLDMTSRAPMDDLIYACLVEARNNKLCSVSFPALGTGILGVDPGDIAIAFKTAIKRFYDSSEYCSLSRIRIVIFEKKMMDKFIDILEGLKTF